MEETPVRDDAWRALLPPARIGWLLVAIVLLGAALRFGTLDIESFDYDEAVTSIRVVQPGLGATVEAVESSESSPPLYYSLAWGWSKLFGEGESGLRALSALFGVATIVVGYAIGVTLASRREGILLAALVAVSPILFEYSNRARPYSLLVLACAASFLFFLRARDGRPADLAGWGATSAVAIFTHYFAAFLVAAEGAYLLATAARRPRVLAAASAVALAALAVAPLALGQEGSTRNDWIATRPLGDRIADTLPAFLLGREWDELAVAQVLAVIVLVAVPITVAWRHPEVRTRILLALGIGLTALALPLLLVAGGVDYYLPQNVLPMLLPILAALSVALCALRPPLRIAAVAVLVSITLAATLKRPIDEEQHRPDYRGVARTLDRVRPELVLAPPLSDVPFQYYIGAERDAPDPLSARTVAWLEGEEGLKVHPLPPSFRPVGSQEFNHFRLTIFRAPRTQAFYRTELIPDLPDLTKGQALTIPRRGASGG